MADLQRLDSNDSKDLEEGPSKIERSDFPVRQEDYPYSAMYLIVNGQIESASIPDYNGICIKFDMLHGLDWHIDSGNITGVSQHAYKSMQTNDRVVWNYPFEMTYRFNDVPGWPKVCLTLTCRDFWGRDVICGYGIMHVPTFSGAHTRYV